MADAVREDGTFNFKSRTPSTSAERRFRRDLPSASTRQTCPILRLHAEKASGERGLRRGGQTGCKKCFLAGPGDQQTADGGIPSHPLATPSMVPVQTANGCFCLDGTSRKRIWGYNCSISSYGSKRGGRRARRCGQTAAIRPKWQSVRISGHWRCSALRASPVASRPTTLSETGRDSRLAAFSPFRTPGSYRIINTYQSDTGKLTVKKLYEGMEPGDEVPDTTFTLYRYYVTRDGKRSTAECVASHTLSAGEIATTVSPTQQTGATRTESGSTPSTTWRCTPRPASIGCTTLLKTA